VPESPAAVAARLQKQKLGGVLAGGAVVGFLIYAFTKWYRETEEVMRRPDAEKPTWERA
jgi:hypothetical protein